MELSNCFINALIKAVTFGEEKTNEKKEKNKMGLKLILHRKMESRFARFRN